MAMEKKSPKSKKGKDKMGEPILSGVEVHDAKAGVEARHDVDEEKKSNKRKKENKDKTRLSTPGSSGDRNGDGPFDGCRESDEEQKSKKKKKKARKDEPGQPIVHAADDNEGDDTAKTQCEPDENRKSKKRQKERKVKLGQSIPIAAAKECSSDDPVDAGREPEDERKLKKKKKKTMKDKWGQTIPKAAGQHGGKGPGKAVRQASKLQRGTEGQAAKTYQYEPKKVVVSGMPYSTKEEEIQDLFKDVGPIAQMQLTRFPDSGNFRGLAFITFQDEEIAEKALELDGAKMGNRFVKVERCRRDPQKRSKSNFSEHQKVEGCCSVYVGKLSREVTEDDVRNFFCDSKIKAVRLAVNKKTGKVRGFCHVDFADDESLELAISKNGSELQGRNVKVSYAVSNKE